MKPVPTVLPSPSQNTLGASAKVNELFRSRMAEVTIFSNGAQVVGAALAATGQPKSLGRMKRKRSSGLERLFCVVLLKPSSVPLTLTLYHVTCASKPFRKVCGA